MQNIIWFLLDHYHGNQETNLSKITWFYGKIYLLAYFQANVYLYKLYAYKYFIPYKNEK